MWTSSRWTPAGFVPRRPLALLPGLGLIFAYSDAHRCIHPRAAHKSDLSFMAVSAPRWTASQLGRHPTLGPGEGVLMSNADVGSMTLAASRFAAFSVPGRRSRRSFPPSRRQPALRAHAV
jgi:hypothetical protein